MIVNADFALKAVVHTQTMPWEKSPVEGVPLNQPALSLASKLLHRAEQHGQLPISGQSVPELSDVSEESIGELLLSVVSLANKHGIDPEFALRARARNLAAEIQ